MGDIFLKSPQAYSPAIQQYFTTLDISYGVQYEIIRLISLSRLRLSDVTGAKLENLRGNNTESAPEAARRLVEAEINSDASEDTAFAQETAVRVCILCFDVLM